MAKAPIGKRVAAYIIDAVLVTVLGFAIGIIGGIVLAFVGNMLGNTIMALMSFGLMGLMMVVVLGYTLIRDGLNNGASYGKKFMKLKVEKLGTSCTMKDSALRNVTFAAGVIPVVGWLIVLAELIMPFVDKDGLRFGDKIAKTQVVEA